MAMAKKKTLPPWLQKTDEKTGKAPPKTVKKGPPKKTGRGC
jgi:hypothetical protein